MRGVELWRTSVIYSDACVNTSSGERIGSCVISRKIYVVSKNISEVVLGM